MILVTGATGFLGRHLVPRLRAAGYPVRALVRPSSQTQFLQVQGVELAYTDDISAAAAVIPACQGCEMVVHAAGHFRFWGDLPTFWQTNVGGTAAVLEAAAATGVKRFIHISTVVVVGRTYPGRTIDEDHPCQPQDFYQRTKWEAEQLARHYQRERGLPVIILRPAAFYGPWGAYAFNRLFFQEPLRGWRIKVNGGRHITFPVYAPDVAEAVCLALQHGRAGEIYNIADQPRDHNMINAIVSDLAGISRQRLNVPIPAVLALARAWTALARFTQREPYYPIDLANYVFQDWIVSAAKATTELGFRPTPFVEGARATLDWMLKR
jgi:nucleoside-diphosphate-sugar epimerase